jgi:hypothetical protein
VKSKPKIIIIIVFAIKIICFGFEIKTLIIPFARFSPLEKYNEVAKKQKIKSDKHIIILIIK